MNVFHRVTLQTLRKNKTRTVVTIIGIILSAAMICAVTTFVASILNYALQNAIYSAGDWHGNVLDTDKATYEKIKDSGKTSEPFYGQQLGYAKIESVNTYKPYLYVLGGEKDVFAESMPVHLTEGTYPKDSTEIILPVHLVENGGVVYAIGDKITLELGERMRNGVSLTQQTPAYSYNTKGEEVLNDEVIEVRESRTYTVVGFYARPSFEEYTAPGYTALTVADEGILDGYRYDIYFKMKDPEEIYDFMLDMGLNGDTNGDVLIYLGVSQYDSFSTVLWNMAVIVILLIMFGSVSLIYNAFSISVSERTKQFGLLSSVGATKRQLRRMVLYEAFVVSAIGIPLGILVGVGGIAVTLLLIGYRFAELSSFNMPMRVCVTWESIVIAIVVALLTVLISAWIPSKRATKVSAVEAIRLNRDITDKNKPVKTSRITYQLFGLPGVLASKYYKRSKKKYRTTVLSLFMSIVLFVSAAAFTDYTMSSVDDGIFAVDYELLLNIYRDEFSKTTPEQLLELIEETEGVERVAYYQQKWVWAELPKKYVDKGAWTKIKAEEEEGEGDPETVFLSTAIYFINDGEFEQMLDKYDLEREKFLDPDAPLAIAVDGNVIFDSEAGKYTEWKLLDSETSELHITEQLESEDYMFLEEFTDADGIAMNRYVKVGSKEYLELPKSATEVYYTLKAGKTIYGRPFFHGTIAELLYIYPISLKNAVLPTGIGSDKLVFAEDATSGLIFGEDSNNRNYWFTIQSFDHETTKTALKKVLAENGLTGSSLIDLAENEETNRNLMIIIQVFAYGFIVLISLIAVANVFNTISTNVGLRRREFAMLKSVGMTNKGFRRMINFECLLYGSRALVTGIPVSIGIAYLMYLAMAEGYDAGFLLPWDAIGIAVLSVFAVVFATMMYSMRKIRREDPIEGLKNENL